MKKTIGITILILLNFSLIIGQELAVKKSKELIVPHNELVTGYLGDGIYTTETFQSRRSKTYLNDFKLKTDIDRAALEVPFENSYGYKFVVLGNRMFRWVLSTEKETKKIKSSLVEYSREGKGIGLIEVNDLDYSKK